MNKEEIDKLKKEFLDFYPKIKELLKIEGLNEKTFEWFKEVVEG